MAYHPFYSSFTPFSSTIPPLSPSPYGHGYSSHYNHDQQPPLPYSQPQPPPYSTYTPPYSNPYTPLTSLYSQSQPPPPSSPPLPYSQSQPPPLYSPPLPYHSTATPPPNPIEATILALTVKLDSIAGEIASLKTQHSSPNTPPLLRPPPSKISPFSLGVDDPSQITSPPKPQVRFEQIGTKATTPQESWANHKSTEDYMKPTNPSFQKVDSTMAPPPPPAPLDPKSTPLDSTFHKSDSTFIGTGSPHPSLSFRCLAQPASKCILSGTQPDSFVVSMVVPSQTPECRSKSGGFHGAANFAFHHGCLTPPPRKPPYRRFSSRTEPPYRRCRTSVVDTQLTQYTTVANPSLLDLHCLPVAQSPPFDMHSLVETQSQSLTKSTIRMKQCEPIADGHLSNSKRPSPSAMQSIGHQLFLFNTPKVSLSNNFSVPWLSKRTSPLVEFKTAKAVHALSNAPHQTHDFYRALSTQSEPFAQSAISASLITNPFEHLPISQRVKAINAPLSLPSISHAPLQCGFRATISLARLMLQLQGHVLLRFMRQKKLPKRLIIHFPIMSELLSHTPSNARSMNNPFAAINFLAILHAAFKSVQALIWVLLVNWTIFTLSYAFSGPSNSLEKTTGSLQEAYNYKRQIVGITNSEFQIPVLATFGLRENHDASSINSILENSGGAFLFFDTEAMSFKQWDPGKKFSRTNFYNLEDKVGLDGV